MFHKVEGILLNSVRYTDSSYIVNMYTRQFGRQSYVLKGVRNKKSKVSINYLQPLFLLEFECTHKGSRNLNAISELGLSEIFQSISIDPIKNAIAFFIADVLDSTLKEAEENASMFSFLKKQIIILDQIDMNVGLFSIYFMINYTRYLGISPDVESMMQEHYFSAEQIESFNIQFGNDFLNLLEYKINHKSRQAFLEKLILYYQIRFDIGKFKSYEILKEVFA